ncbi:DUF3168 domain-containing protein [Pseudovibrio ascidiaceicola]|uniref:DUF3168 domain-containing protein n=1 Tax=Pseudovibrio ascidiaceicola TaxID=285279 RepID=UPI000D68E462|nr:DUF3168 domain-containing protein [Pseudovibrio ascidiaceicola]
MIASPDLELQKAVIDALSADVSLMALVHDVYDSAKVPSDQAANGAPWGEVEGYVSFGPETEIEDNHDCFSVEEITLQIDCWSRKVGRVHVKQIMQAVRVVLKSAELVLPSYGNVLPELELKEITPDPETGVMHGILQFTFDVQVH